MSRHPVTEQPLILQTEAMQGVRVEREIAFGEGDAAQVFDLYRPAQAAAPLPVVVFVPGYPDAGARAMFGCGFKDWAFYVDWARLVASAGMIAITYRCEQPLRDARALLQHLQAHASLLGIDPARVGLWSCSGNCPTALAMMREFPELRCAALSYGYLADLPGHDEVSRAAAQFGFAHDAAQLTIDALTPAPLLIVRAGRDEMPGLNASLDRFASAAIAAARPVTVVSHGAGPHAFDMVDATPGSRAVVQQVLQYLAILLRS